MEINAPLLVRMLLRVSSGQQLDADGDLAVQRNIVTAYIAKHREWMLDTVKPEYYEGGVSGYKNSVKNRQALQDILADAENREFQILVCYKDDRLGRREDEIPQYIKKLASFGVLIFTVKDGCITPQNHTDSLINFIRYWHAEGASRDTSQRVKDTARENVRLGKNQGGKAPYGYHLVFSGEFSKHQRALKKKVIDPERAEIVRYMYNLAGSCGYGYSKITSLLNEDERLRLLSPNGIAWKSGTVRDILRNPIYTGYLAYNRRTRVDGHFITLDHTKWILSEKCDPNIRIIDPALWNRVQELREMRRNAVTPQKKNASAVSTGTGRALPLLDILYCGSCGRKMINGSKYNYWTTKDGIKHRSRVGCYRCPTKHQGGLCQGKALYRADDLETGIFAFVTDCLTAIQDNTFLSDKLAEENCSRKKIISEKKKALATRIKSLQRDIEILEESIPKALRGEISFSSEHLSELIHKAKEKREHLNNIMKEFAHETMDCNTYPDSTGNLPAEKSPTGHITDLPPWPKAFMDSSVAEKCAVVNRLISRIDICNENIHIHSRICLDRLPFRNPAYKMVSKQGL
ncbi:MAG TPA: recombinase family protein [Lachnospiraceae bacterium]|nr:recombinase family protein [Lachnospiraceae bacterium]